MSVQTAHPNNPVMVNTTAHYGEGWGDRSNTDVRGHWIWCPGCQEAHHPESRLPETRPDYDGPLWDWNGDVERPTFSPSILTRAGEQVCHSFIRDGQWEFLSDSTHQFAGQTVPMAPVPDWLVRQRES